MTNKLTAKLPVSVLLTTAITSRHHRSINNGSNDIEQTRRRTTTSAYPCPGIHANLCSSSNDDDKVSTTTWHFLSTEYH
jgi:hypothetical protein